MKKGEGANKKKEIWRFVLLLNGFIASYSLLMHLCAGFLVTIVDIPSP
jgi:hypothetical protein